jgi:predicted dinucleotide-binding enzyme
MADPIFRGVKSVMFVAGDDTANKPRVIELVGALGFEVVDVGPLRNARLLEAHATRRLCSSRISPVILVLALAGPR